MKYLIFSAEIIAIAAVVFISSFSILKKIVGILIIIALSQICHRLFKAR